MTEEPRRVLVELPWPGRHMVAMALLLGLPVLVAWRCPGAFAPFLFAWVLAYLLNPIVVALERVLSRVPLKLRLAFGGTAASARPLAVIVFFLWLGTVIALIGFPIVVALISNIYTLADNVASFS